ncbi:DUF917 domain-containing protein [Afifella pfennigii]|uniref:DUF917 domain-containing protein n=1 Tax=Afifella pfennigii TaxID=209897 RepID=UPI00047A71B2|nr:DUF917 domain-containing protein [Afifella pfennigii]
MIGVDEIDDICLGAAILGTGGGGDPYIGGLVAKRAIRLKGAVEMLDVGDVPVDDLVVTCGNLGAPTVYIEKLVGESQPVDALRALEHHLGRKVNAVMAFEAGGSNSAIPIWVAAATGLPLVDADGQGRAFPELQMVTFGVYGVSACPMAMADEHGGTVVLNVDENWRAERIARAITVEMGARASIAAYPMTGAQLRKVAIAGTMGLSWSLGRRVRIAREQSTDVFATILEAFTGTGYNGARILFEGKVADVRRETRGGWAVGEVRIAEPAGNADDLVVTFQNENLLARSGSQVRAIVPDLICILDSDQGLPITTERLRFGLRVTVIVIGAPDIMRTPEALAVFGPLAFGLDTEFVPQEDLA